MQTATTLAVTIDPAQLPSMLATLCSYESWFGPYHPQTLNLMTQVAIAYWQAGELDHARPLLERVVRDVGRFVSPGNAMRLQAMAALRDLLLAQLDLAHAVAIQRELLDRQVSLQGSDHPETLASRAHLAMMLLAMVDADASPKV